MSEPTPPSSNNPFDDLPEGTSGRRQRADTAVVANEEDRAKAKKKKIILGSVIAAVFAILAITIPLILNGLNKPAPVAETTTPSPSKSTATPTPTPTEKVPNAPKPNGVYEQVGPPAGSPLEPVEPLNVTIGNDSTGTMIKQGLAGLSLEMVDMASPTLSADNPSAVKMLKDLNGPMVRFGGNSVERRAFWTSTGEPLPGRIQPGSNQTPTTVTPEDLRRVNGLLEATGSAVAIVVDLANFEPERAADFVKNAKEIFGDKFLGFTPGNEPNGYPANNMRPQGWADPQYIDEIRQYADAIAKVAPNTPMIGPGTYEINWGKTFAQVKDFPLPTVFAFHHYPYSSCNGSDPTAKPTIANMLNPDNRQGSIGFRERFMQVAKDAGLPIWIPEMGPSACPGNEQEFTKQHVMALWYADYALSSAQLGVERLGFHSSTLACLGGPSMSPICNTGTIKAPSGEFAERANYWGMSIISSLPPGEFLGIQSTGDPMSYAYAMKNNEDQITVAIVNMNNPERNAQTDVTINLPFTVNRGTMTQMYGPAYTAQDQTVIDGQYAPAIPEDQRPGIPGFDEGKTVKVPLTAGTVTVLTFRR